jgi:predicted dehydrogenase
LALSVLASAADLYLEKPPVASMKDFLRLQEAASAAGRSVQIGFQSLGSHALATLEKLANGEAAEELPGIGTLKGISATGRWVRDRAYYKRSRWAGKRSLDGVDVVDGVATNPLAHAIATALRIAGARHAEDLASVETDLYRANDIEADDTSVIRMRTANGLPITCALTLCAAESVEPYVTLHGTEGTAVFHYTEDRVTVRTEAAETTHTFGRDDLTENLLHHLSEGTALLSPLDHSGAFMRVLEAIRTAEAPALIPTDSVDWVGTGDQATRNSPDRGHPGTRHPRPRHVLRAGTRLGSAGHCWYRGSLLPRLQHGLSRNNPAEGQQPGNRSVAAAVSASRIYPGRGSGDRSSGVGPCLASRGRVRAAGRQRQQLLGRPQLPQGCRKVP